MLDILCLQTALELFDWSVSDYQHDAWNYGKD